MKNKKIIAALIFSFVILGVFYFVYQAFQSESTPDASTVQINQDANKLDQMQNGQIPNFQATTIQGNTFHFTDAKNKVVILNFWASWCGPCVEEFPSLIKLVKESNGQVGLIAISLDTDEMQMQDFLSAYDIKDENLHILKDPQFEIAQQFGTYKLPESYILDSNRKLVKKISGSVDWTSPEMSALLKPLL